MKKNGQLHALADLLTERGSSTYWIEEWLWHIDGLNTVAKIKMCVPLLGIDAQSYSVTTLTELGYNYRFIVCPQRRGSPASR
jgi:hypothetical protein